MSDDAHPMAGKVLAHLDIKAGGGQPLKLPPMPRKDLQLPPMIGTRDAELMTEVTRLTKALTTVTAERDNWIETAGLHHTAETAFLAWLREAGEAMRSVGVTVCDDGTDSGHVLAAKVPECARLLLARAEAAEAAVDAARAEGRAEGLRMAAAQEPVVWTPNGRIADFNSGFLCGAQEMARAKNAAILALITAPAQPADGWQPIETAPKDGKYVLVHGPLRDGTGTYGTQTYMDVSAWWGRQWAVEFQSNSRAPTHWRPLPAPPAPREGNEG